jgi:hypothetical protein
MAHSEERKVLSFWRAVWRGNQEQPLLLLFGYNEDGNISDANFCWLGETGGESEKGNGEKMDVDLYIAEQGAVLSVWILGLLHVRMAYVTLNTWVVHSATASNSAPSSVGLQFVTRCHVTDDEFKTSFLFFDWSVTVPLKSCRFNAWHKEFSLASR